MQTALRRGTAEGKGVTHSQPRLRQPHRLRLRPEADATVGGALVIVFWAVAGIILGMSYGVNRVAGVTVDQPMTQQPGGGHRGSCS